MPPHRNVVNDLIVYLVFNEYCAQWNNPIGDTLGGGNHVRYYIKLSRSEWRTQAAPAGDNFIKDQQDIVPVTQLAQALQVTNRWHDDTAGTTHWLNYNRCNAVSTVEVDQVFQCVSFIQTLLGQTTAECIVGYIQRVWQMVNRQQWAKIRTVRRQATN